MPKGGISRSSSTGFQLASAHHLEKSLSTNTYIEDLYSEPTTCHATSTDYRTQTRPTTTIKTTAHAELEQPEKVDGLKQPSPSFSFYTIVFDFPRFVPAHAFIGTLQNHTSFLVPDFSIYKLHRSLDL